MLEDIRCKIIRLKDVAISEIHGNECLEMARSFGLDAEFFDAISGYDYEYHIKKLGIAPHVESFIRKQNKLGVYGCLLSHFYLWRECLANARPYLILEHDGLMLRPLPSDILDSFDDVLTLDRLDPYSIIYDELLELEKRLPVNVYEHFNHQYKKWKADATAGNHLRGAYAYLIKPKAAMKLLKWVKKNGFLPADHQIGSKIVDIKMIIPSFARLHPAYRGKEKELSLTTNLETLVRNPVSSPS